MALNRIVIISALFVLLAMLCSVASGLSPARLHKRVLRMRGGGDMPSGTVVREKIEDKSTRSMMKFASVVSTPRDSRVENIISNSSTPAQKNYQYYF
jgi:hypothetical protein